MSTETLNPLPAYPSPELQFRREPNPMTLCSTAGKADTVIHLYNLCG